MKLIPLIALPLAALCTAGTIAAYMLIGRTEPDEPFRAKLRRPAAVIAEAMESASNRIDSEVHAPPADIARSEISAKRRAPRIAPSVVSPFAESPPPEPASDPTDDSPSPTPASAAPRFNSHLGFVHQAVDRTDSAPVSSRPSASRESAQPLRNKPATPARQTPNKTDGSNSEPADQSQPEATKPGPAGPRTSAQEKQRPPWPRGNFTVEEQRIRTQIGWQAFADEIFENSLNPPQ